MQKQPGRNPEEIVTLQDFGPGLTSGLLVTRQLRRLLGESGFFESTSSLRISLWIAGLPIGGKSTW
jgi:hypothetical protein